MQAQEVQTSERPDASAALKRTRGGAWKDHWVAMLVELRGCLNEEFMKPQKQGADMWTRVASEIAGACDGFDKDSESCRKKWQKVYKAYKEDKARMIVGLPVDNHPRTFVCKWFHLVDKHMQNCVQVKTHSHTSGTSELVFLDEATHADNAHAVELDPGQATCVESSHTPQIYNPQAIQMHLAQVNHVDSLRLACSGHVTASQTLAGQDHTSHHSDKGDLKGNAKRARRDQNVEECLSQMAETWKDALEAMKEADTRRIEVLQSLAVTMAGLLDVLRKW